MFLYMVDIAGLGVAGEADVIDGFIRVGTEYTFLLGKAKRLFIAPGTFTRFLS